MVVPTAGGSWWTGRIPEDRDSLLARIDAMKGRYRPATGPDRIWDHEAIAIANGRDPQVLGIVARRFFDNGVIADNADPNQSLRNLDMSPGLSIVRIRAQETYRAAIARLKLTLGTLTRVATALEAGRGRKEVLLVSEGFAMDQSQPEFRQLVQAARRSNSAIHFLDARAAGGMIGQAGMPGGGAEFGRSPSDQDATTVLALTSQAVEGARSIAIDTGGSVVPSSNGLGREMARIAQESRAYYLLGYAPTNARRDGSFRKVTVDVTRPGRYEVRARRGYYASKAKDDRVVDKKDLLDPQVRASLDAPFTAAPIPLRLTNYVTGGGAAGKVPVFLLGEADVAGLHLEREGDRLRTVLETFFVVQPRGEGTPAQQEKLVEVAVPEAQLEVVRRSGIPLGVQLDLAPGVYQARLVVRERDTGRLGTVRHEFEVQAPSGLRLSSPILTDSFHAAKAGDLPRPVPVARRSFARGARLGVAHEIYGASTDPATGRPNLTSSYLVRSADGASVATGPKHPLQAAGAESVAQMIVVMAPAEAGDYEFVLTVTDEVAGATVEAIEPFTVTP